MKIKITVSKKIAYVSIRGTPLIADGSKRIAQFVEKVLQTEHVPISTREVGKNLLASLQINITRKFVSLLKSITQQPCSEPLQDIQLELVSPDTPSEVSSESSNTKTDVIIAS